MQQGWKPINHFKPSAVSFLLKGITDGIVLLQEQQLEQQEKREEQERRRGDEICTKSGFEWVISDQAFDGVSIPDS